MASSPVNIGLNFEGRRIRSGARCIVELRAHVAIAPSKNDVGGLQGLLTCDAGGHA
jgi:hypothetical protein